MYSLEWIGKYGNSDPHYKSDWVKVDKYPKDAKDFSVSTFDDNSGSCNLGNGFATLNIYYKNIGRVEDPQRIILSAEVRYDQLNEVKFVMPDKKMK